MTFANAVANHKSQEISRTENGMKAFAATDSKVLDLFTNIGAGRDQNFTDKFMAAMSEDVDLTLRVLMWARDIRGGAGERKVFRDLLRDLEVLNPEMAGRLLPKIPVIGRWDDVFAYADPINRQAALSFYAEALANGDGLAFKWAPREKSAKAVHASALRRVLDMTPRQYRKYLVEGTNVVETLMCSGKWDEINFSHVPSLASSRYQKAFGRNAEVAYAEYIRELQKPAAERDPKVKVNAGAVYPYDVLKSSMYGNVSVSDAQWEALPNFVGDAKVFPMIDVSGSMHAAATPTVSCMNAALSLGLYVSEKNTGDFKDMFLTFSSDPEILSVSGTLSQRLEQIRRSRWGMSTNLHAAFERMLEVAVRGRVSQEDMPDVLLILSDMQFNYCAKFDDSAMEMIARKYRRAGYEMPKIVFWNLRATDDAPAKFDDKGVALISGLSPSIMRAVLSNDMEDYTPYNVMLQAIMDKRYDL